MHITKGAVTKCKSILPQPLLCFTRHMRLCVACCWLLVSKSLHILSLLTSHQPPVPYAIHQLSLEYLPLKGNKKEGVIQYKSILTHSLFYILPCLVILVALRIISHISSIHRRLYSAGIHRQWYG